MKRLADMFVLIIYFLTVTSCSERVSLENENREYDGLVGSRYKLMEDCYIFTWNDGSGGLHLSSESYLYDSFPKPCSSINIGFKNQFSTIVGTIESGSVFRVENIYHRSSFENFFVDYEVRFVDKKGFKGELFNIWNLTDQDSVPPRINTEYAKRVTQGL